jgi:hypothetical protein
LRDRLTQGRSATGPAIRLVREEDGLIRGLFVKTILWFALLAVVGHDVGQIVWTQIQVSTAAHKAAEVGANAYFRYKVQPRAEQEALGTVAEVGQGIELKRFKVDRDGSVWTSTAEEATTFVVGWVGFLKGFAIRHAAAHEQRSPF